MRKILITFVLFLVGNSFSFSANQSTDPIGVEISRWRTFIQTNTSEDDNWKETREFIEPLLLKAEKAYQEGRRLSALHLLAFVQMNLAPQKYIQGLPPDSLKQMPALEDEWKRIGVVLQKALEKKEKLDYGESPAVFRAVSEVALSEVKPLYEASLDYGQNTVADSGFYYLGAAQGQLDFARFCSTFRDKAGEKPSIPSLLTEIDSFEDILLANYKPPASIEQHPLFIRTSAQIKQARELYDAGMYYGALYRYLDARQRLYKLTNPGISIDAKEARAQADQWMEKLKQSAFDNTIAQLFIEMAVTEASDPNPSVRGGETANAIFADVLPHYFAAMDPEKNRTPKPEPSVAVTLVRWPYT